MFIKEFIAEKYVMLIELAGLCIVMLASVHIPKRVQKWTLAAVLMLLADAVMIRVEFWTQSFETLSPARPVLTFLIYLIQPLILIVLMQITTPFRKKQWLLTVPWLLCVPIYASSQFTGIVCRFTEENSYTGGPLSWLPYIIFGFYVAVFFVLCLIYFRRSQAAEKLGVVFLVTSGVLGVVYLAFFINSEYLDFSDLFTAEMILYYLFLYIHFSKSDPLTGLFNRQCFYKDMEAFSKNIDAACSIDMNELKYINDMEGHSAGDAAIKDIAGCLLAKRRGTVKSVYRIGGDEFAVFYYGADEEKVRSDIEYMKEKLAATRYTCAFGYSMFKSGEDVEETFKRADQAMYAEKSEMKAEILRKGGELHRRSTDRA